MERWSTHMIHCDSLQRVGGGRVVEVAYSELSVVWNLQMKVVD